MGDGRQGGTDQTKRTDLGGKSGRGSNLTSDGSEVDDLEGGRPSETGLRDRVEVGERKE